MTELETSARPERKRMTNHNTLQLSGMDSANHCAAFPGLLALSATTILWSFNRIYQEIPIWVKIGQVQQTYHMET
jgi:hypothetical protein